MHTLVYVPVDRGLTGVHTSVGHINEVPRHLSIKSLILYSKTEPVEQNITPPTLMSRFNRETSVCGVP